MKSIPKINNLLNNPKANLRQLEAGYQQFRIAAESVGYYHEGTTRELPTGQALLDRIEEKKRLQSIGRVGTYLVDEAHEPSAAERVPAGSAELMLDKKNGVLLTDIERQFETV